MTAQLAMWGVPWTQPAGKSGRVVVVQVPSVPPTPAAARDATLDALAERRAVLVAHALRIAIEQCDATGETCGPMVLTEMRRRGLLPAGVDARFIGAVLLPSQGFTRTGELRGLGSKCRPVPMWSRR